MVYRNNSFISKTFYGVTFLPGSIHDVKGYINDPNFVRLPKLPSKPVNQDSKSTKLSKEVTQSNGEHNDK